MGVLEVVFTALELDDFHTDPEREELSKLAVAPQYSIVEITPQTSVIIGFRFSSETASSDQLVGMWQQTPDKQYTLGFACLNFPF